LLLAAGLAFAALSGPVAAADMPLKARPLVTANTWTGCYLGGNIGYGWSKSHVDDTAPGNFTGLTDISGPSGTGIVGGGQLGCDYQMGNVVIGARGLFDGANLKGSSSMSADALATGSFSPGESMTVETRWFATLTARLGYAVQPQWLVYVNGGVAWANNKYKDNDPTTFFGAPFNGEATGTRTGWTIGGGVEYKLQQNWSVFAEYDYIGLSSADVPLNYDTNVVFSPYTYHYRQNVQTLLFGVNYRF
jgi:outer membrane immunogenic protein